jgi:hypothetical protein
MDGYKPKTFWERPEGVTGALFLVAIIAAVGFVAIKSAAYRGRTDINYRTGGWLPFWEPSSSWRLIPNPGT